MAMQSGHVLDTASTVVAGCTYEPLRRTTSTAQRLPPVLVKVLSIPGYIGDHSSQYRAFWAFAETRRTFSKSLHLDKRSVVWFLFVLLLLIVVLGVLPNKRFCSLFCCFGCRCLLSCCYFPRYLRIVGMVTIAIDLIGYV